ncbi:MAG TPA: bifunctional ornithine acetyltransferase/N-acetylglutamate synthase, partial [Microvirga sp.]|nr:bifunctional ornithine acetyltransferase/N-acetylglutamate synthase [Microvirga sp.]
MSKTVSPLAPKAYPTLPPIEGVRIATAEAGIRYRNRTDVLYVALDKDTAVAGVFTRSKCPSAPVDWCRRNLARGTARALVVNSGNANAFTGKRGAEAVKLTADLAAAAAGCRASQVFIASTGVIGEPLEATKFEGVLQACEKKAKATAWVDAAKAIMTTDTFPKVATRTATIGG